jgi:hypothetical protein
VKTTFFEASFFSLFERAERERIFFSIMMF